MIIINTYLLLLKLNLISCKNKHSLTLILMIFMIKENMLILMID